MPSPEPLDTTPYWSASATLPRFPALARNLTVDAVVIGGGMTGATAAYLLKKAGLSVALVERGRCGQGETSHTTAHLSAVTDMSFPKLVASFGADHAQAVWDSGFAAIGEIDSIARAESIDCDFRWVPGYLVTNLTEPHPQSSTRLRDYATAAEEAEFDAELVDAVPGLRHRQSGIRFDGQAKFHPLKFLRGVLECIPGRGCHVFEDSMADEVTDEPLAVKVGEYTIKTTFVVVATHVPIVGAASVLKATLLQTDLYPYSTYAIGAKIGRQEYPEALYWDLEDPYHYLRIDRNGGKDFAIFGGEDHKTGQADDTKERFTRLERTLGQLIPDAEVTHRWSGQVVETRDGLPYIGETAPHQFAMTGFSGNGLTFGVLGAMMARDQATGRTNPWRELYDINRTRITKGIWDYVSENKDYPYYMVRGRFAGAQGRSLRAIRRGEGKILELEGKRLAAYRDADGTVTLLSPVCTHLGCLVTWNAAETSWDCPCHGSRFTATGNVMGGPAEKPLAKIER